MIEKPSDKEQPESSLISAGDLEIFGQPDELDKHPTVDAAIKEVQKAALKLCIAYAMAEVNGDRSKITEEIVEEAIEKTGAKFGEMWLDTVLGQDDVLEAIKNESMEVKIKGSDKPNVTER